MAPNSNSAVYIWPKTNIKTRLTSGLKSQLKQRRIMSQNLMTTNDKNFFVLCDCEHAVSCTRDEQLHSLDPSDCFCGRRKAKIIDTRDTVLARELK